MRRASEALCLPLEADDYQIQSIVETSPPKWHLAHVTWFFETFLLRPFLPGYRVFHPQFEFLFNSYYYTIGDMQPRPRRGLLSRPTVEEVYRYREYVDTQMRVLIESAGEEDWQTVDARLTLGLHHEQQHQELLLMDIKHNFWTNPLRPAYKPDESPDGETLPASCEWREHSGGVREIGYAGDGFAYDNESPRHRVWVDDYRLCGYPVTNGEYLGFMADDGYRRPELWLADGWALVNEESWRAPLYWEMKDEDWWQMTLGGMRPLRLQEPVCHVSYYEADAYARWAGKRLPTEMELELELSTREVAGNFMETGRLHPRVPESSHGQWFGDVWEWTASPYMPYPGFTPLDGGLGEYNGKFMGNQWVLKGGACVTPASHVRSTYRNFFYPRDRWQFAGIRLAETAH